eukprot:172782-Prymnesium_polylepis.2
MPRKSRWPVGARGGDVQDQLTWVLSSRWDAQRSEREIPTVNNGQACNTPTHTQYGDNSRLSFTLQLSTTRPRTHFSASLFLCFGSVPHMSQSTPHALTVAGSTSVLCAHSHSRLPKRAGGVPHCVEMEPTR